MQSRYRIRCTFTDAGKIRYDFEIAPGADPGQIQIAFDGSDGIAISDTGDLIISGPYGDLTHLAPRSFQDGQVLDSAFEIKGEISVGFVLGNYDRTRPVTIDPAITYSTYLGGSDYDQPYGLALDGTGSAYVTGMSKSADFPLVSALDSTFAYWDVFVTKFAPDGQSLIYSTYLGGSAPDSSQSIEVDITGSAYVAGYTQSSDFPVAAPFQPTKFAGDEAFVTKLAPDGQSLIYSTYLGGSASWEGAYALAVDNAGSAYVTGHTMSADFPMASPYDSTLSVNNVFLTKFAPDGQSLIYSTYLGGTGGIDDRGWGIAVDASGSAYVTGATNSPDFPVVNAYDSTYGPTSDGFVTKFAPDGQSLVYSTYLGGTGTPANLEVATSIAVDSSSSVYVTGRTNQSNFPVANAYDATLGGSEDSFLTKFSPDGQSLIYSTYLGGSGQDAANAVIVDSMGSAYLAGGTGSADFPTVNAFQPSHGGDWADGFLTKFTPDGQSLIYSTYIGGSGLESASLAKGAVSSEGGTLVFLATTSGDLPLVSPFQGGNAGDRDVYIARISAGEVISGTFTGGINGSISVYGPTGNLVAYSCCMTSDYWYVDVPAATCPAGYRILWLPPDDTKQAKWFDTKDNYSSANCVSAPSSGNDMTIPSSGLVTGYVKDATTAADIDGAVIYAFKSSDGSYAGYAVSGAGGNPGRFTFTLSATSSYKFRVAPPAGHVSQWHSGKQNYTEATPTSAPGTVNFSLDASAAFSGYVKDKTTAQDLNGYPVYVFDEAGKFYAYAVTDRGQGTGRYSVGVAPAAGYKLKSLGGSYQAQWYSGAANFTDATANAAPLTANFSLS